MIMQDFLDIPVCDFTDKIVSFPSQGHIRTSCTSSGVEYSVECDGERVALSITHQTFRKQDLKELRKFLNRSEAGMS